MYNKVMVRRVVKCFLVLLAVVLGIAAFYGAHIYHAASLDKHEIGDGYFDHEAKFALEAFELSLNKYEGLFSEPQPVSPDVISFRTDLDTNSSVHVLKGYGQDRTFEERYEKYPVFSGKWGQGIVTASYRKENGVWFNDLKIADFDNGDSTITLLINENLKNEPHVYKNKRKNGIVTESLHCTLKNGDCGDSIMFSHVDINPVSGKVKRLLENRPLADGRFTYDEYDYDDLGRLVELRRNNKIFRFAHNTKDTTNLDVVIYGSTGVKLGFYKRSRNKNKEVVRYGTRRFEIEEIKYFKDGKLVKSEKEENKFYDHYSYTMEKYDGQGNVVRDSSFEEETLLPGFSFEPCSNVEIFSYQNGKIKSRESLGYVNGRLFPFVLFPLKTDKNSIAIESEEYVHDSKGRVASIVFHWYSQSYASQKIFSYDLAGKLPSVDYTTCWVSAGELESLEWKEVSDLRSESADGKYRKELECSVVDDVLTCEKVVYKKFSFDYLDSDAEVTWDKCIDKDSINDTLLSVTLSKDSLVYLNETMLESNINLKSILCEGCEIREVQDSIRDEKGKLVPIEHIHDSFRCKIGRELYEFSNWISGARPLSNVAVSFGDTTGVPDCLVGFKSTNGIALGMTMKEVDSLGLAFKKGKKEWEYSVGYPLDDQFTDSRTILLNFRKGKVNKIIFDRSIMN